MILEKPTRLRTNQQESDLKFTKFCDKAGSLRTQLDQVDSCSAAVSKTPKNKAMKAELNAKIVESA